MSNLETIYRVVNAKFVILRDVAEGIAPEDYLNRLRTHYGLFTQSVSPVYMKHLCTTSDEKKRQMLIKFVSIIRRIGTKTNLEILFTDLQNITESLELSSEKKENVRAKFNEFKKKSYIEVSRSDDEGKCCGTPMSINACKHEMVCKTCSKITPYQDAEHDHGSSQSQDRTSNGRYNPNNYVRKAIIRLFAREQVNVSDDNLKKMIGCRQRDNIPWSNSMKCYQISCEYMRKILKELRLTTNYNKHIPKLRAMIGGPSPPDVTSRDMEQLFEDTNAVITAFKSIKPDTKANSPYYYYFIYKVADLVYEDRPETRKRILECIHIQDVSTIDEIDRNFWKPVTDIIPKYRGRFHLTDEQEDLNIF